MPDALAESAAPDTESVEQELNSGPAPEDTLGAGIFEEANQHDDAQGETEQPGSAEGALAAPAEEQPAGTIDTESPEQQGLRQADYTRKTEQLAREREDFATQRAEMEQQRTALIAQQSQQTELLQKMSGQVDAQNAPLTTVQSLQQQVADAQTYEDRQQAENTLNGYQIIMEQQRADTATQVAAVREEMRAEFQEAYGQPLQQIHQSQRDAAIQVYRDEAVDARAAYGDAVDAPQVVDFVKRNLGMRNDAGEQLTITELVGMQTGKPAAERANARAETRQQRFVAKGQVTPLGAPGVSVNDKGGPLTRAEAIAVIEANPYPGTAN